MYKRALLLFALAAALFTLLWWTQRKTAEGAPAAYAALEKSMKESLEAWQKSGRGGQDPRIQWLQSWRQFAERYPTSEESARAHVWSLSLMASLEDGEGLAQYLQVAVRYPDNTAVPTILDQSTPLYVEGAGAEETRRHLTRIAETSHKKENQASARYHLASLAGDDDRRQEALEQFVADYGDTQAAKQAQTALEEIGILGPGAKAPPFEFTDLNGKKVTLEGLRGKWVVVDFWASWCPPCIVELPAMKDLFASFEKNDRFAMLGISLDYERDALVNMLEKEKMTWPQFMDGKGWDNPISRMYRVSVLPTTYLIDPQGVIRYRKKKGAELKAILTREIG